MPNLTLEFIDDYAPTYESYEKIYQKIFRKTLKLLNYNASAYILEVRIVNEDFIRQVNKDYRNKDSVTDVISFAFIDEVAGEVVIKDAPIIILGEILICAPRAKEQAIDYGHSEEREFSFLFVHGLLHLLGYDHHTPEEEKVMFDLQDQIIGKRILK